MKKTKLYRVLSVLSQVERNRLSKFLPGEHPAVSAQLIKILLEGHRLQQEVPSREAVFHGLDPSAPFDDLRFRKICSDAVQILERFLSLEAYYSDPLLEATTRLMSLARKQMLPLYRSHLSRVEKLMQRWPEQGANYYYHRFLVEQKKYQMDQANLQRFEITNIDQILHNLDVFYIIEKLRFYCEILSRKTFVKHQYNNRLIDEILSLVQQGEALSVPVISIYYHIVLTHLHPDEKKYYFELKQAVNSQAQYLPEAHRKEVFDSILNYCNRKINQGHQEFLQESFDHYQEVLQNELIYIDGLITHWTFKNVVVLALRLGEFEWAENFILRFADRIEPVFRENAVKYNLAQLYFYRKDFAKVITLLQEVEYDDVSYNLGAKTMLLATYYELEEFEPLRALGESFRAFINRRQSTISEMRRKSYLNLISFTLKLSKVSTSNQQALTKIMDSLQKADTIASEHWIRDKVQEKMKSFDGLVRNSMGK